jgi:catechol 2,3-dioxygenase-like lactoylglutathione lyase family enzyme
LANASRWSLSARQGFLACALVTVGLFVLPCGTAMDNVPVAALGVAVGLLGPIVIILSSVRANRPDVFGTAHVSQSSAPPTTGLTGPAELHLVVNAKGVHNAVVRIRDADVPVSKWPDIGTDLPVLIPSGNPRRLQVLWDQVRGHHDLTTDEGTYSGYPDEAYLDDAMDYPGYPVDEWVQPEAAPTPPPEPSPEARRRPSPRPRPETAPADSLAAFVPVSTATPPAADPMDTQVGVVTAAPAAPAPTERALVIGTPQPPSPLPRRVPGVNRPAPTPAAPADQAPSGAPAGSAPAVEPDPPLAPYLADEPEEAQQGLGEVHNVGVTVIVSDLRRSLAFYRDLLGLTEIDGGRGSAILVSGDARILLRQVADTRPIDRRVVHLNLEVDDVHEAYQRLRRQGLDFMHAPRVVDQGEELEQWAATLRDPDGHAVALTHWEVRS